MSGIKSSSTSVVENEAHRIEVICHRLDSEYAYIDYQMLAAKPLLERIRSFVQPDGLRVLEVGFGTG